MTSVFNNVLKALHPKPTASKQMPVHPFHLDNGFGCLNNLPESRILHSPTFAQREVVGGAMNGTSTDTSTESSSHTSYIADSSSSHTSEDIDVGVPGSDSDPTELVSQANSHPVEQDNSDSVELLESLEQENMQSRSDTMELSSLHLESPEQDNMQSYSALDELGSHLERIEQHIVQSDSNLVNLRSQIQRLKEHIMQSDSDIAELSSHIEWLEQEIMHTQIETYSKIQHLGVELAREKIRNLRLNSEISTMKKELTSIVRSNMQRGEVARVVEENAQTKRENVLLKRKFEEGEKRNAAAHRRNNYLLGFVGLVVVGSLVLSLRK